MAQLEFTVLDHDSKDHVGTGAQARVEQRSGETEADTRRYPANVE